MPDGSESISIHVHRELLEMARENAGRDARRGKVSAAGLVLAVILAGFGGWLLGQTQARDEFRAQNPVTYALGQYARGCR